MLVIAHLHARKGLAISLDSLPGLPGPRLELDRAETRDEFFSSLIALLRGPAPPEEFPGDSCFRDCWIEPRFPRQAFVAAIAIQALLIVYPPPIWNIPPTRTVSAVPSAEIAWYDPAKDFPPILPALREPTAAVPKDSPKPLPRLGADAFHPRQTILSTPLHPTHPRQMLLQPNAPQEPPKILPALPNIVQLASSQPARPKLQITAKELTALRPKTPASLAASNVSAPEISTPEKQVGAIDIAASSQAPPKPLLPVNPMAAPREAPKKKRQRTRRLQT